MNTRDYNIGSSNYSQKKIQPWDIWEEYNLDPWDADIIKRVLRTKKGEDPTLDYEKIIHICQKQIERKRILKNGDTLMLIEDYEYMKKGDIVTFDFKTDANSYCIYRNEVVAIPNELLKKI